MNIRKKFLFYSIFFDFLSSSIAWTLFYIFRKVYLEPLKYGTRLPLTFSNKFFWALILVPLFWIFFYWLAGNYKEVLRKSRLKEFMQLFFISLIGVTLLFFAVLLDDEIANYKNYYLSYITLFFLHFTITSSTRLILSSIIIHKIRKGQIFFNTLIIGANGVACKTFKKIEKLKKTAGNRFIGFVNLNGKSPGNHKEPLERFLPYLGSINNIKSIIEKNKVEEVIIAIEASEHKSITNILNKLEGLNVQKKIVPDMYSIISGQVKMTSILDEPLIHIETEIMPQWQKVFKRLFDIIFSIFVIILLSPLFIIIAILIKISSEGPIFYTHYRIGLNGKPFKIYKFRSMYKDAEKNGPMLSNKFDKRITPVGKFIRKYRIDELPQFFNVLKGDMSIVGPRPEREYYIKQIIKKAPHYKYLHKVRPGITSWGQIKYGYAENVNQMIERLKYDIIYLENMSILVDFKIIIYTILTVLKGKGR